MKVVEFIEKVKNEGVTGLKEMLAIRNYVPFAEKYDLCSSVLDECNDVDEKTGIVTMNSVMKHKVFTITILSLYTNLEFSSGKNEEIASIDEYDMLCENKLLQLIINEFASEYRECQKMLDTMQNDLLANNNNLYHIIGNMSNWLFGLAEPFLDVLKDKIESFDLDLSQDNIEKYISLFEKINMK